nr:DNA mismatch repair protein MutS [Flavihumibacter rivuli]
MDIDKTSLLDLSIFHQEEEFSIFHRLNFTQTSGGRDWLAKLFQEPFKDLASIRKTQDILRFIGENLDDWPTQISNGTIMVIEKFYETPIDTIPHSSGPINGYTYKLLHNPDYSLLRYSISHFGDLVRGFQQLSKLLDKENTPPTIKGLMESAAMYISAPLLQELAALPADKKLSPSQVIEYGHHIRYRFKNASAELINIFSKLDAWYSMALAMKKFNLSFPSFKESDKAYFEARDLYHILLPTPVAYDVSLGTQYNFLFLTGANMAGKSTFIKSVGAAVYLAHLGMGVPARTLELSLFEGILSNINVTDNIIRGESYFFNEVQRIKNTILKINDGRKWLVLIDELFKGTNVQDAMKCSLTVIKGLIKIPNSLFILSTHLYEIGEELKPYPNISFKYFETAVTDDQLQFSYQLKEGISNDRLGYLILKREKVVELLDKL